MNLIAAIIFVSFLAVLLTLQARWYEEQRTNETRWALDKARRVNDNILMAYEFNGNRDIANDQKPD